MSEYLDYTNKIGILDPEGLMPNPLTNEPYTEDYKKLAKVWSALPGYSNAKEILQSIADNQLTIAIMGTGTGKSVLVPKFALHYTAYKGKVGMTLPKQILALGAAEFAAKTLDVPLGKDIGYVYKGSDKTMVGPLNKILYMTDGVLTMKLLTDPDLSEFKVIIIDEAHERKVQIDLILLFLKKLLLSGRRPDLRVVLMSATIDGKKYQEYFEGVTSNVINVEGQPNYPIEVHFLENPAKQYIPAGLEIIDSIINANIKKDILFFITTSKEALDTCTYIRSAHPKVFCIEVYSQMDKNFKIYAQDKDKYLELGNYDQKIVLATNVAESSLTIDGLKYVIDSCYELFSYFNPDSNAHILETRLISKAQAFQRRGRVGRTESGICYHLLTESQFDKLEPYPEPDILREDITIEMLKIINQTDAKSWSAGYNILVQLMDIPKSLYINYAHNLLKLYHILDSSDYVDQKLSSRILQFSSLALNQSLFLIFSYELFCAKEASIILGMMDALDNKITNLFFKADTICNSECKKTASVAYVKKIADKKGDHLTFLKIFEDYKSVTDKEAWARKYGIRLNVLKKAGDISNRYYRRIITASKVPQTAGADKADVRKKLIEALKKSHLHLIANKSVNTYAKSKHDGQIQQASVLNFLYTKKELANKKFIFNELVSINNNWEYSVVTLI